MYFVYIINSFDFVLFIFFVFDFCLWLDWYVLERGDVSSVGFEKFRYFLYYYLVVGWYGFDVGMYWMGRKI